MTSLSQQSAENPINDLIDFASLKKQLESCAADSTAEHIGLLKQAVLTIDSGLKETIKTALMLIPWYTADRT